MKLSLKNCFNIEQNSFYRLNLLIYWVNIEGIYKTMILKKTKRPSWSNNLFKHFVHLLYSYIIESDVKLANRLTWLIVTTMLTWKLEPNGLIDKRSATRTPNLTTQCTAPLTRGGSANFLLDTGLPFLWEDLYTELGVQASNSNRQSWGGKNIQKVSEKDSFHAKERHMGRKLQDLQTSLPDTLGRDHEFYPSPLCRVYILTPLSPIAAKYLQLPAA